MQIKIQIAIFAFVGYNYGKKNNLEFTKKKLK